MPNRFLRRAGLTINPLVFLLLLVLVALVVWQGWMLLDIAAQAPPSARATGTKIGIVMGCTFGVLLATAIAGGVGAGLYFMAGRSEFAANLGIGIVLLLACCVYGFGDYLIATREPPAQANAAANTPAKQWPPSPLKNEAVELMEAQKAAMRQQMDAVRQGIAPPAPSNPGLTRQPGPANSTARPSETVPATPPAPSLADNEETKAADKALAPLREEVRTTVDAFLTEAGPVVTSLGSSPRALRSELDSRVKSTTTLKGKAADLEAYFRALDAKAEAALKAAGLEFGAQIRQKIAFSQSAGAFEAANAAGVYQRLFDAALEEAQALRDNAGKWRYDAGNQLTSTDRSLQMRLRRLHEVVGQHMRSIPEAESALKRTKSAGTAKP